VKNKNIENINKLGQSIWYDNLSRDLLTSGDIGRLIESGVSGLTSNPTIFKKAIADTNLYDSDIRNLSKKNLSHEDICEQLFIEDVGAVADLLKPVYEKTGGQDGFASIEVSPLIASDTTHTIEVARRLWSRLNRPNIMVKVPATKEGIPAIQALLEEGINVNITLIFSVDVYEEVMEAYIKGLEARASTGKDNSRVASVASFFVSRVDAICEKTFDTLLGDGRVQQSDRDLFFGKLGIANSKAAYQKFLEVFKTERFKSLESGGARVQRPLWASTGTKNPDFSPLLYVEQLVGPDTVNTLPPETLNNLLAGADVAPRLTEKIAEAEQVIANVGKLGLSLPEMLFQLQVDGVKSFADSYRELLESIEFKLSQISK